MDLSGTDHAPASDCAISPPDDFYYASLYLAPPARHALRAVEAARRAITDIPGGCTDRGIAHLKLAWWQTELQQLTAGTPRHPVAQALLPVIAARPALLAILAALLDATLQGLNHGALVDRSAVTAWVGAQQRDLLDYYMDIGPPLSAAHRAILVDIGCLLEIAYALRGLRQHRRATPLLMADAALRAAGLSADGVRAAQTSRELQGVLEPEIEWLRAELMARCAALPRHVRRAQRLLITLAACAAEALALTRADDCQVLERRIELLPVRKLWLAWRVRNWG